MNESDTDITGAPSPRPDRLTVFAWLWASQALVHQEFYSKWLDEGNVFGWILTVAALGVWLKPRSLLLFSAMLTASSVYNFLKWPFVVNHILLETIINLTILAAIAGCLLVLPSDQPAANDRPRDRIYDQFAPVVMWMLIAMYYFAFVAKLNDDFFDPAASCVAAMYNDLVRRVPFLPTDQWAKLTAIWATIVIEAAIPLLLTFRRTRNLALVIGLPFHLMLGLIGHRTFAALAYALYGLFLIDPLASLVGEAARRARHRWGEAKMRTVVTVWRIAVISTVAGLIAAALTGHYRSGLGPLSIFHVAWAIWILWSLVIAAAYFGAMALQLRRRAASPIASSATRPTFLWAMFALVLLNGMSQYLGLKTETSLTMYSNLRTEGNVNNHLFLPALRLVGHQDDLIEVIQTDHPELTKYLEKDLLITFFEFRRVLSESNGNCSVTYRREGDVRVFRRQDQVSTDPALSEKHPAWLAKLLHFRPVPKGPKTHCQH